MQKIYLDNAATTPIRDEVLNTMIDTLKLYFGNPSSKHQFGRNMRAFIEESRILIAKTLNVLSSEIIFTSGGTEANNLILRSAIWNLDIKHVITSSLEHKSVLETILDLKQSKHIIVEFVKLKEKGVIDLNDLEKKLEKSLFPTLVSLMYANNEIGNIIDINNVGLICKKYQAYFHSDMIQAIGHYRLDIGKLPIDFASASAHKFYGPTGIGFAFIRKKINLKPVITGGGQERNMRSGTENIYAIIGLSKSLELAYISLEKDKKYIENIKLYCISSLKKTFPKIIFNGLSDSILNSLYSILNISLPIKNNLIGFELDLKGIAVSQGSSCESISTQNSYIIKAISDPIKIENTTSLRISFGIFNKINDIDILISALKDIIY